MSAETEFHAVLAGYANLTALVGTRIAQSELPEADDATPYVVFDATHAPEYGVNNNLLADQVTFEVTSWATDSGVANSVADQVQAALSAEGVVQTARATVAAPDIGMYGVTQVFDWLVG